MTTAALTGSLNDMIVVTPSPRLVPANDARITDWLTGIGTVALAFATVVTLIVTVWITTTDRRRAEDAQRRDRQQDATRRLIGRIGELMPYIRMVPAVLVDEGGPETEKARQAVRALEYGAHTDVSAIGDTRAAQQYTRLAYWVAWIASSEVTRGIPQADRRGIVDGVVRYAERVPIDLLSYTVFVRVSLESLIQDGHSLDPGSSRCPDFDPILGDWPLWEPSPAPQRWIDALKWEASFYPAGANWLQSMLRSFWTTHDETD